MCHKGGNAWRVLFYTPVMVGVHVLCSLDIFESAASIRLVLKVKCKLRALAETTI